jgi:hypothetical protein
MIPIVFPQKSLKAAHRFPKIGISLEVYELPSFPTSSCFGPFAHESHFSHLYHSFVLTFLIAPDFLHSDISSAT